LDISLCSTYPQHEIEREVEVVLDEIESYNDSPGELIYDEFEALSFPGHPLGRNILGEADRLREIRTEDVSQFTRRNYLPGRMVLYVYGRVGLDEVARQAELSIARLGIGSRSFPAEGPVRTQPQAAVAGAEVCTEKSTHQAHVMMGTRGFSATDPRHLHLYLLNNMLGGPALSSRLNMSLRERNGLVYSVESSATAYTDTGLWSVYFGCDHHDVARCRRLVLRELARLAEAPLSQRVLDAARRQLKGQIGLSYDNAESVALDMAKRYLHYGRTQTKEQLFERLDALTPDELWLTAQEVFAPERITTLIFN
ncbi:MAG: insulinase family protein, partial [Bacteroidaceae bacterium]|nr:insulinase family protein [Bacteroidaceae bacterium]